MRDGGRKGGSEGGRKRGRQDGGREGGRDGGREVVREGGREGGREGWREGGRSSLTNEGGHLVRVELHRGYGDTLSQELGHGQHAVVCGHRVRHPHPVNGEQGMESVRTS